MRIISLAIIVLGSAWRVLIAGEKIKNAEKEIERGN